MKTLSLSVATATLATLTACAMPPAATPRADLLGMAAPPSAATRTVILGPGKRWVNVTGGETVRFVAHCRQFAWNFSVGPTVRVFDLNRVAPPGLLGRAVPVYVDPDPYYSIRTDWNTAAH